MSATLEKFKIVHLTANIPGPMAASRLVQAGASVTKIESPAGDPLEKFDADWYRQLHRGQTVVKLDLRQDSERERLLALLKESDLFIASLRPSSLGKLKIDAASLQERFPKLGVITIQGYPAPLENVPAHDLTCQADAGLIHPPALPRALIADFAAAERVFSTSLLALLHSVETKTESAQTKTGSAEPRTGMIASVALSSMAEEFSFPWRRGITTPDGPLGGANPAYGLYQAKDGWMALAALEPHFMQRLLSEFKMTEPDREELERIFLTKTRSEWERFAELNDLPLLKVNSTRPR